jgi:hypothetical protein
MFTRKQLPYWLAMICCIEILIYLWSVWTSTFDASNFFAIKSQFIFDKCARIAGRISSALILMTLLMVGYYGLKKIYVNDKKKEIFLLLMTMFSLNHLIHLLFVYLRFHSHDETINFEGPLQIGGTIHGVFTFTFIVLIPFVLWIKKNLHTFLYIVIHVHLFNICSFIIQTFLGKIKPPEHPAYQNQFGIVVILAACLYMLYRLYIENKRGPQSMSDKTIMKT